MPYNHTIKDIKIPYSFKNYLNNYIKESLKLYEERGHIEEFICRSLDASILNTLIQKNILEFGYFSKHGILIPTSFYHHGNLDTYKGRKIYMLSDEVIRQNGFSVGYP